MLEDCSRTVTDLCLAPRLFDLVRKHSVVYGAAKELAKLALRTYAHGHARARTQSGEEPEPLYSVSSSSQVSSLLFLSEQLVKNFQRISNFDRAELSGRIHLFLLTENIHCWDIFETEKEGKKVNSYFLGGVFNSFVPVSRISRLRSWVKV